MKAMLSNFNFKFYRNDFMAMRRWLSPIRDGFYLFFRQSVLPNPLQTIYHIYCFAGFLAH